MAGTTRGRPRVKPGVTYAADGQKDPQEADHLWLLPARTARCYPLGVETGIAYALAAALFWGTSPVLVKRGLRHSNVSAAVLLQQVGSVLTLVLIMVLPFSEATLRMPWSAAGVFVSVGLVGSFLGRTFVLKGIDEIGASKAQSISNSAPLLTAVYAIVLLGETATPIILIGVVLIVTGLLIITRGTPDDKVTGRPVSYKAFLNPLLSIIFFGFGPILKKVAMLAGGTAVPGALITHLTGLLLIFLFGRVLRIEWREGIRVSGDSYFFLLLSGLFQGVGSILTYLAVAYAPAIIVAPIWNVQPLITFSLARLILRGDETVTLKDGLAAVLVVAGVFFLFQSRG